MGHGIWDEDALEPKKEPQYNVEQLESGKFEALEAWHKLSNRHDACPNNWEDPKIWVCDDCRAIFPDAAGCNVVCGSPCTTYGHTLIDKIVDEVLALGPKKEEKPFEPYYAIRITHDGDNARECFQMGTLLRIMGEHGDYATDSDGKEHTKKNIVRIKGLMKLPTPTDVTGQKSMVEKIKEEIERVNDDTHTAGWRDACEHFFRFITYLEAEAKEEDKL